MMNKKNLKMKPVGSEYMEQYNALLRYVFQVTEHELSSIGWQEKEIIRAKFPTMQKADVIGWFDDDNLVSQVCLLYTSPSPRDGLLSRMPSSA